MLQAIVDVIRRVVAAGGTLRKVGTGWLIGDTADRVSGRDVGRMFRAGALRGSRRAGVATVTAWACRVAVPGPATTVGAAVTFRDTGYHSDSLSSRYRTGVVLAVLDVDRILVVVTAPARRRGPRAAQQASQSPSLWEVRRPHTAAPWKAHGAACLALWAPGAHAYDAALWSRISSVDGLVPAAWSAPVTGDLHTLDRLRWAAARMGAIGAYPRTAEEHVACDVFRDGSGAPPHLSDLRYALVRARRDAAQARHPDLERVDYLEGVLRVNVSAARAAELKALTERVSHTAYWIWSSKYEAVRKASRVARSSSLELAADLDAVRVTLEDVAVALADEVQWGSVDATLLPDAFALYQARFDARRAAFARGEDPDRESFEERATRPSSV